MPLRQPSRAASVDEPIRFEPPSTSSLSDEAEFNQLTKDVTSCILVIVKLGKMLDNTLKILGGRLDSKEERDGIQVVRAKAKAVKEDTTRNLERLNKMTRNQKPPGNQKKVQVGKLSSDFKGHLKWYTELEIEIVLRMKTIRVPEQRPSVELENETAGRQGSVGQYQSQTDQQLRETLEFEQGLLLEREERIRQIEADILDVNDIMKQLANMVEIQGEDIDTIAANVIAAEHDVEAGTHELEKAVNIKIKSRKRSLCLLPVGLVLLITVIIVLVVSLK